MLVQYANYFCKLYFVLLYFCIFLVSNLDGLPKSSDTSFFFVENLDIRRQNTDPLRAKREALKDSLREAFLRVLFKNFDKFNDINFTDDEISSCLYDYSIKAEKYSDSFYIASISYRFNKEIIAELLQKDKSKISYPQKKYEKFIRVAIYITDFIENYKVIKKTNYRVEKFSNNFIVLILKDSEISLFRKLSIKYAEI